VKRLVGVCLLMVLASGSLAGGVSAQSVPGAVPLDVATAVSRALELGEEAALAREQVMRAEAQVRQARAGAFPQVSGSLMYDRTLRSVFDLRGAAPPDTSGGEPGGIDFGELFGDLPFGQPNTWIGTISLGQTLYTGGRVGAARRVAHLGRTAIELNVGEVEAAVAREVREGYFQAALAESMVTIAGDAYDLATEQLRVVESFFRQGTVSEFEVLQARVERDNLEPQIVGARNARDLALANLKRMVNIPQDQPIELVTPLAAEVRDVDRDAILEAALSRPALQAAAQQVAIQESLVQIARADRLPTVSAFGNFSWHAFPDGLVPTGLPGGGQWREDWGLGFQVAVPIFDGFRASGAIQEARSNVRRAALQATQLREGVRMEVAAALAAFDAARAQIEARRATVTQAARGFELAELRYSGGLATLLEVSNARLLLQQARLNEADALFAYLSSLAALEHVTGGQVELVNPVVGRAGASPVYPERGGES
jgi:outer membrane protein